MAEAEGTDNQTRKRSCMKTTNLSLQTRKGLAVAAEALRSPVPAVFVTLPPLLRQGTGRTTREAETREQAELRRERVESLTRRPPEVVITSRWVHTASAFDAQRAVVLKLPLIQRIRQWLRTE